MVANSSQTAVLAGARARPGKAVNRGVVALWRRRAYILLVLDFATVLFSFLLALYLFPSLAFDGAEALGREAIHEGARRGLLLAALWVGLFWHAGGYETGLRGVSAPMLRVRSLVMSGIYAMLGLAILSQVLGLGGVRRFLEVFAIGGVAACLAMVLLRLGLRSLDRRLAARGIVVQRVAVAGMDEQTLEFAKLLRLHVGTIRLAGFLSWNTENGGGRATFAGRPVLGSVADVEHVYERHPFEKLIVSAAGSEALPSHGKILEILNFCEERRISLYMLPRSFDIAVAQHEVASLSGVPLIRLQDASIHPGYALVKRLMDVVLSLLTIALGMPIWAAIVLAIRHTSKGPIFFTQTRVGLHGKRFKIYKFRTMVPDAEGRLKDLIDIDQLKVPGFKIKNDPRVTPFGRFLRGSGLDEVPQLINVLKGEMSLVGPRPELPALVERYTPEMRRRLKAKPGITGYQQVIARGIPLAAGVKYDLVYLKHQSLLLDVYIMARTVGVVFSGRGVSY